MTELEWRRKFSDRLAFMMRRANMSRLELAESSGITKVAIGYYLTAQKTPGFKSIINLAYVLGCTIEDLIDFGEQIQ